MNDKHYNRRKYRKFLPWYKTKLTFASHSLQLIQIEKWQLTSGLLIKHFNSEMIFFGLYWEKNTSYRQKHFRETNNCLRKVSTVQTKHK